MLKDLIKEYPTPESRKKKEVFVYRT